jgi:hypothetical protein
MAEKFASDSVFAPIRNSVDLAGEKKNPVQFKHRVVIVRFRRASRRQFGFCHGASLNPALRPLPALRRRTNQFDNLGHFEPDFIFNDFNQRDIRQPKISGTAEERPSAGIQLPDPARDEID